MPTSAALIVALKEKVDSFFTLINSVVKHVQKRVVAEAVTLTAGQTKEYDLQTLLGTNHAEFDKDAARVMVRVKDTTAGSETLDMFINSEALVTVAVRLNRYVRVINTTTESLSLYVCVDVPRKA